MYFSEQGNVDDNATLITIFLASFNLQSCCLMQSQSAVCSLQMSYTAYRTRHTQCVARLFLRMVYVGSLLIERCIHSVQHACSFAWLMSGLCLQNEAHTMCSTLVPSRGLCRIVAYRKMHTQCVARLFLRVVYVGSLLIERGIHNVQHACSIAWLMSDRCLQKDAYTVL